MDLFLARDSLGQPEAAARAASERWALGQREPLTRRARPKPRGISGQGVALIPAVQSDGVASERVRNGERRWQLSACQFVAFRA